MRSSLLVTPTGGGLRTTAVKTSSDRARAVDDVTRSVASHLTPYTL